MITLLGTYLLPFKHNAPCAALLLAVMLHSTGRQCAAECAHAATQAHAAGLYAGARAARVGRAAGGRPVPKPALTGCLQGQGARAAVSAGA